MLRSLYAGISGMKVNQTKLDVVGNNVANVGTTAFKTSRTRFQDMLSQNVNSALGPSLNQGGVNPSKVGLGVKLAGIDTVMAQGSMQPTSRNLDMAVDGEGYFMTYRGPVAFVDGAINVENNTLGNVSGDIFFTRDGSFTLDSEGNLLNSDGLRVLGYSVSGDGKVSIAADGSVNYVNPDAADFMASQDLRTLRIPDRIVPSAAAAAAKEQANVDFEIASAKAEAAKALAEAAGMPAKAAEEAEKVLANATVDAALADAQLVKASAVKTAAEAAKASADAALTSAQTYLTQAEAALAADPTNTVLQETVAEAQEAVTTAEEAAEEADAALDKAVAEEIKATAARDTTAAAKDAAQADFDAKKAIASDPAVVQNKKDKEKAAEAAIAEAAEKEAIAAAATSEGSELRIISFTVEKNGLIKAVCEGGKVAALGQIAMASFKNPGGLEKVGGNLYKNSANSGEAVLRAGVGAADDNSKGYGDILQGMLEMSNVDLAEQFTEMIVTSRAFQASGKMITTGDEILQDIINLKR
jgi:flagellar hook protein FlgE